MIYNTFKDIEREYGYALNNLISARDCCARYLCNVLYEVGSIEVMIGGQPALITNKEKRVVFYQRIGQGKARELDVLSMDELYDLCKQVRGMRLVEEYGDENENPE
jgi:hypothetical protein